jgi:hypothetical protein
MTRLALAILIGACAVLLPTTATHARQMDPKQVAGIPLPVADVPLGTVVVRVIKGALSNNIADQAVELRAAGSAASEQGGGTRTAKTDASGRAQFSGLQPGSRVVALANVGGESLQSQEMTVPSMGGLRVLLVASDSSATSSASGDRPAAAGPAVAGSVVLGEQSRFVVEFGDGSLSVFNVLQIVNSSGAAVQPARPIVFDLPQQATGLTILQDSAPATINKGSVTVQGPFPPGSTLVQFAYSMPYSGADLTIEQSMPIPLNRVIVLAQKMGETRLQSPNLAEQREMAAEGQNYIVGQGPAVAAGGPVTLNFSGLPHHAQWPRFVAIGLALVILAAGAWASFKRTPAVVDKARTRLETKRDQLFAELTSIEEQHRDGRLDPQRYASKRQELVAALERVYEEIERRAA